MLFFLLAATAAANFTTTLDYTEWIVYLDHAEKPAFYHGSIINVDQNRTTAALMLDKDAAFATDYHPNGTESFTWTFGSTFFKGQAGLPNPTAETKSLDCVRTQIYAKMTCTRYEWNVDVCTTQTTSNDLCTNGTMTATGDYGRETYWRYRPQVVLTAGLEKLATTATEALNPSFVPSTASTSRVPEETGGVGTKKQADIVLAYVGAAAAIFVL